MTPVVRGLLAVPSLALGAAVSLCTLALHDLWWGLALGLAATAATAAALPPRWWGRLAFALGWVALLAVATPRRAEGDYLVSGDVEGYVLLGAGAVLLGAAGAGLLPRARGRRDSGSVETAP